MILGYIAETFPDAALATHDDPFAFGQTQAFNVFLTSSVHVAFAHKFRAGRYADGEAAAAAMAAKVPAALDEYFGMVEAKLSETAGPWVHGERYTVSDPYLYLFTRWFNTRDVGGGRPQSFARVQEHYRRMGERPAVQRALEQEGLR